MGTGTFWRSEASAQRYAEHDYADFAQEFLQRNPDYRSDFTDTQERIAISPKTKQTEEEGLAGRWGLRFPHPDRRRTKNQPRIVVAARSARRGGH
jgi:Family of unknown function (DUF6499)